VAARKVTKSGHYRYHWLGDNFGGIPVTTCAETRLSKLAVHTRAVGVPRVGNATRQDLISPGVGRPSAKICGTESWRDNSSFTALVVEHSVEDTVFSRAAISWFCSKKCSAFYATLCRALAQRDALIAAME